MQEHRQFWDWEKFDSDLSAHDRERASALDAALHEVWDLGRNVILCWAPSGRGIVFVAVRYYTITDILAEADAYDRSGERASEMRRVVEGPILIDEAAVRAFAANLGLPLQRINLPFQPGRDLDLGLVNSLVRRYAITLDRDRAVALFDIVGFSLGNALEQVTQLNSLSRSLNLAQGHLAARRLDVDFSRSTTGDGYYVWNRGGSPQANLNLYHLIHLALADNAIGRPKARSSSTPLMRSCFHVGSFYEFFQPEGLSQTIYDYIVGDATIEVARLIANALPGQILVGDFRLSAPDCADPLDTVRFIERTRASADTLKGLVLAGETVESIKCYLTGERRPDGTYGIKRYLLTDKHGRKHVAYNAKINVHLRNGEPIFLGLQDADVDCFDVLDELSVDQAIGAETQAAGAFPVSAPG